MLHNDKLLGNPFRLVGRALAFKLKGPVFKPSCRQSPNMLHQGTGQVDK